MSYIVYTCTKRAAILCIWLSHNINIHSKIKKIQDVSQPINSNICTNNISKKYIHIQHYADWFEVACEIKLIKEKALMKHSLHRKIAVSVLLKLFISGNERCHTTDTLTIYHTRK